MRVSVSNRWSQTTIARLDLDLVTGPTLAPRPARRCGVHTSIDNSATPFSRLPRLVHASWLPAGTLASFSTATLFSPSCTPTSLLQLWNDD